MADPVSLSSGLLALVRFTFQSSNTLCTAIQSYRNHPKSVRELIEELEALAVVLHSLSETVERQESIDLAILKPVLFQCGKACQEFEDEVAKCLSRSSESRIHFGNWAKLQYLGGSIDEFRMTLASYKSTIAIAVADSNLRQFPTSNECLDGYKSMIRETEANLQERLDIINEKIHEKIQSECLQAAEQSSGDAALAGKMEEELGMFENIYRANASLLAASHAKFGSSDVEQATGVRTAPTDSGYASLSRPNEPKACDENATADMEDANTIYSMTQSVTEDDMEMYTTHFAEALADYVASEAQEDIQDPRLMQTLGHSLPRLLRAFALRLGYSGSSKAEREVMFFIDKYKNNIASRFQSALTLESQSCDSGSSRTQKERVDKSAVYSFIQGWLDGLGSSDECQNGVDDPFPMPGLDHGFENVNAYGVDDKIPLPNRHDYAKIVFESVAYRWLTASVKTELSLAPVSGQGEICGRIYSEVLRCLEAGRNAVRRRRLCERLTLHLKAGWDLRAFLRQQFSHSTEPFGQLLAKTITLTGSATDAQALPCEMYIRQTWPVSGPCLLSIINGALSSGGECEGILPDNTLVKLKIGDYLQAEVQGPSDSVVEVTEQIAWLGAALRVSDTDDNPSLCLPDISIHPHHAGLESEFISNINFATREITPDAGKETAAGQCWHKLFRNPVIVQGYPIPRRSKYDTGLEIPLNMMSRLAESPRIHQFLGKHLLKGFSIAIVPTERADNALLWHLYCTDNGSRLPYPDIETTRYADVTLDEMEKGRHILGWCTEANLYAGSKGMNYAIQESRLKSPGKDFSLEKVSFSVGQIVTGGCQFSVGHRDIPVRIIRGGYIAKLRWIRQRYFTLWDVDENRGWLIDGATTLLHLLRTSLNQSFTDEFCAAFLFDESKFCESSRPFKAGAALEVLLNPTNRFLDLYREDQKTGIVERVLPNSEREAVPHIIVRTTTIQDRVEELYETLEKLVDHKHRTEASYKGIDAKLRLRDHLEGWDFADLAGDRDPNYSPRGSLLDSVSFAPLFLGNKG